jgi:hypothetical protein
LIQFPIIKRLEIRRYGLFQNEESEGIAHAFERGVHAVVGINGLGKTTLLNILYRALLGPYDQSKSDDAGLLGSQHELSTWRNRNFFRDRVSDAAREATVEIDVAFGKKLLTVRRRLSNLQIEHLSIDGVQVEASLEKYADTVVELSGTATFFDFFAILRYLVFFLEDRVELIWDRRSQFDMLRVLLFDTAAAKAASEAYDTAQAADSRSRNRRAILGRDRDRLAALEAASGDDQAFQFRALQTAIAEAEEQDREQAKKVEEARENAEESRLRREKALLDLQEARIALEYEEQAHYKDLFPEIGETAQHVFLNLLSGGGCLVCGSVGSDVADHLRILQFHHDFTRTPSGVLEPWSDAGHGITGEKLEIRISKALAHQLDLKWNRGSVLAEVGSPSGRMDIYVCPDVLGAGRGPCVLEIKVLRSNHRRMW